MKNRILSAVIPFFILTMFTNGKDLNQGYIQLMYLADISKPSPVLIFYLPGTSDSAYKDFYNYKFEIAEQAFEEIRKSTESREAASKDAILINSYLYQFTIVINGETSIFMTPYLDKIRHIFQIIIAQFKDQTTQKKVKLQLDDIIFRLKGDSRLN